MSELLLVNPRRRKRKSTRKNPRRMTAKQAKYFGPRRRRRSRARRAVASVARVARRTGRRVRRAVRRFASNRSGGISLKPGAFIRDTLVPSAIGGAGALAVDVAWGALPIPAAIKTGPFAPIAKIAGAVAVGLIASKVAGKKIGAQVTSGYLTVFAYNLIKGMAQKAMPNLPLGDYSMGYVQAGQFLPDQSISAYLEAPASVAPQMGAYLNGYEAERSGYAY